MKLGIFTKTWPNKNYEEVFYEMAKHDITCAHLNMINLYQKTLPSNYDSLIAKDVKNKAKKYGIELVSMSGTFNILYATDEDYAKFEILMQYCSSMEIPIVTICTGTYSKNSMWEYDIRNENKEAFEEVVDRVSRLISISRRYNIKLGIEPEYSNIISDARKARKILELFPKELCIVFDAANLLPNTNISEQAKTIKDAYEILSDYIEEFHAKDYLENGTFSFAGNGVLNYPEYLKFVLKKPNVPLVLHQLAPTNIENCINYINNPTRRKKY